MKGRLNQNLGLKAISLVAAFIIWLLVVNISQPEITAYQTLDIEVENADKLTSADKTYTMDTRTVRVSYHVRSPQRSSVTADDFRAYVNLADYSITGAVPVYVDVDESVQGLISDVTLNPMVIHVDTEDIQRKRFDITTSTTGRTMEGYMAGEISVSPDYVYVIGPVSEVGQISEVGIEVNVAEANSALSGKAPVAFYDANGNEISVDDRISLSQTEISYELPVYRIKSLSVVANADGTPAEGYMLESVDSSPSFVDVYGDEETLSKYSSITIPEEELSISGATTTVTRSLDITPYLPEGLRLAQPGTEVTIAARIRRQPQMTAATDETHETDSEVVIGTGAEEEETAETREGEGTGETLPEETSAAASQHESAGASQTGTSQEEPREGESREAGTHGETASSE